MHFICYNLLEFLFTYFFVFILVFFRSRNLTVNPGETEYIKLKFQLNPVSECQDKVYLPAHLYVLNEQNMCEECIQFISS